MSWGEIFLGVIALATLVTAVVQVGVLLAAARLAKRMERLTERVEGQLQPLFAHLDAIGREASRAALVASSQVDRVDALVADLIGRFEHALDSVQSAVSTPVREGAAVAAGFRAAIEALRHSRRRSRAKSDDDDALFI